MIELFNYKYKPLYFENIEYLNIIDLLKNIKDNKLLFPLRIILKGGSGSGKTSILRVLKNELTNFTIYDIDKYILLRKYILKQEKILIIIDDIDQLSNKTQQNLKKCLDNNNNINLISTCLNTNKIIESIISRHLVVTINYPNKIFINKLLNKIVNEQNIDIDKEALNILLNNKYNSIGELINYLQKISIINIAVNKNILQEIDLKINNSIWIAYNEACKSNDLLEIRKLLSIIKKKGYSCIDTLYGFLYFVKATDIYDENIKYKIIKLIIQYVNKFYSIEETPLLMLFFSNKLIMLFNYI